MFFEILSLYEFSFGRYFYNMYILESLKLCFPLMSRTIIYFHIIKFL